jgi:hypothetical protein
MAGSEGFKTCGIGELWISELRGSGPTAVGVFEFNFSFSGVVHRGMTTSCVVSIVFNRTYPQIVDNF